MSEKPEIKVGQKWLTRDGRISRIVVTDAGGDYPIMGFLEATREADFYTTEGVSESHIDSYGAKFDLISLVPTTVKRKVALYRTEMGERVARQTTIAGIGIAKCERISEPVEVEFTLLPGEEA